MKTRATGLLTVACFSAFALLANCGVSDRTVTEAPGSGGDSPSAGGTEGDGSGAAMSAGGTSASAGADTGGAGNAATSGGAGNQGGPIAPTFGSISTLDRKSRKTGNVEISEDGFEFEPMRCTGSVCVTGGITP
jgi:hypothetical protein